VYTYSEFSREEMRSEVVGAHELDGGRSENADTVQFPAVGKHGGEAVIVFGG
jgi:hypothetical protein